MALIGKNNEEKIWNFLIDKGLSTHGVAGLMGNLYAESGLNPMNLQNTYEKSLGFTDDTYTAAVNSGKYTNFVHDCAGYGLAQWTYYTRKEALLCCAKAAGTSIGDLETQLGFLYKELSSGYASLFATLKSTASVRAASDAVLTIYECPADMSERVKVQRANFGQKYLDKYGNSADPAPQTGKGYTAAALIAIAAAEIGYHEKASNANLDSKTANSGCANFTKYSRDLAAAGYYNGNKQGVAWCDIFVDWCFYQLAGRDAKKAQEIECQTGPLGAGCLYSMQYYQQQGRFYTSNPQPGDQVFYNSGSSISHTGIVESVNGPTFTTIEGNTSEQVKRCTRKMNDGYTYGFGRPKYDTTSSTSPVAPTTPEKPCASLKYKVGDVLNFTGSVHYVSSSAANGSSCKPGKVKITAVYASGKHPYHAIAEAGGGSTAYGWVDADMLSTSSEIKIGDIVRFKGGAHYVSSNATSCAGTPKAGAAKVTAVAKGAKHPYHLIHTDNQSTVYGWVDSDVVEKL